MFLIEYGLLPSVDWEDLRAWAEIMDTSQAKNTIINDIYKAAITSSLWPVVLERTCHLVDAKSAILLYRDNDTRQAGVFHTFPHASEVTREYVEYYCQFDSTINRAAQ